VSPGLNEPASWKGVAQSHRDLSPMHPDLIVEYRRRFAEHGNA
jgi:hypothetical protein